MCCQVSRSLRSTDIIIIHQVGTEQQLLSLILPIRSVCLNLTAEYNKSKLFNRSDPNYLPCIAMLSCMVANLIIN